MLKNTLFVVALVVSGCASETVPTAESAPAKPSPSASTTVASATNETSAEDGLAPKRGADFPEFSAKTAAPLASAATTQRLVPTTQPTSSSAPGDSQPKTCSKPPPGGPCAGAIGFCPQWSCQDGKWVDVRPSKGPKGPHNPKDPLAF